VKVDTGTGRLIWGVGRLIWGVTDSGVFYTTDGGQSWNSLSLGLPSGAPVSSASIDPGTGELMVSLFGADGGGGVYRGGNTGGVWRAFNDGLLETKVRRLTNDGGRTLDTGAKATTFYAATAGAGVYAAELRTAASSPPRITTTALSNALTRSAYSQALGADGGTTPYSWSVRDGALPAGLRLNKDTGQLTGEAGSAGLYTFTAQVADANGKADSRVFELQVCDAGTSSLSIGDATVLEGNAGTTSARFAVSLSCGAPSQAVTVAYATADGSALAGSDYQAASGTLTFAGGETSKTVEVAVLGDTQIEASESFQVLLKDAAGAAIANARGTGTIGNDDASADAPQVSIDDRSVREGRDRNAAFRVFLSKPSNATVIVGYQTADGTATSPLDYLATSGSLTFTPGRTQHSVYVPLSSDTTAEGDETFLVNLTSVSGATIADGQAIGTISDPPGLVHAPMYRSYNRSTDYHFFTTDKASNDFAVGVLGFQDESNPPPFYVSNVQLPGSVPLFRMYNPNLGRHFYTASSGSRDFLMGIGATYEKDEGFVYPLSTSPQPAGTTELYLLYNNNSGTHLFTADANQKDGILALFKDVWVQHTSVGFVFTSP
jgi:Calx-beta domain-containing protein/putative Ig domain-containing protein/uncharacterized protein DUF5648